MKLKRINILGLQETHMTTQHLATVHTLYERRLQVYNSPDPDNASASAGVAFAIDKSTTRTDKTQFIELVPGRAALLVIQWRENTTTTILNTYAPNSPNDHPAFWQAVQDALEAHNIRTIDFMLGDFNLVEDEIDRTPPHPDRQTAVDALRNFRATFQLQDTWRHDNINYRLFTYRTVRNDNVIQSRLDRIYTSATTARNIYEWDHIIGYIPSDHDMITVRYAPSDATTTGPGRWTMPLHLLTNAAFLRDVKDAGRKLEANIAETIPARTPEHNAQTLWATFKATIRTLAKKHAALTKGRMSQKIKSLTAALDASPRSSRTK
ncbi:DNase I-like protein [Auriscalpium vulgare]|uniref:DNase I-like protein n=1 Tax=Auriscalpium vulgare TaxID=40419 RepID=A0ACB8RSR5_9AGAM|nr:DNase I-like protein [Auriscalpium vulgare]